jgi:hypothetical protein
MNTIEIKAGIVQYEKRRHCPTTPNYVSAFNDEAKDLSQRSKNRDMNVANLLTESVPRELAAAARKQRSCVRD